MKFFTSFEPAKCQPAPTGNGKEIDWQLKFVKGIDTVVASGEIDVYAQIQATAEATPSISELIAQYNVTRDPSIFDQKKGAMFFDLTALPKDIFEMQALQREAQLKFDQLPIEIKQAYDNNLYNFIQDDKAFDKVRDYFNRDFTNFKAEADKYAAAEKAAQASASNITKSEVKANE